MQKPHAYLNHALDQHRLDRGMTWDQTAAELGVATRSLADIRTGRNRPGSFTARRMEDWLGWPHGRILGHLYGDAPHVAMEPGNGELLLLANSLVALAEELRDRIAEQGGE